MDEKDLNVKLFRMNERKRRNSVYKFNRFYEFCFSFNFNHVKSFPLVSAYFLILPLFIQLHYLYCRFKIY